MNAISKVPACAHVFYQPEEQQPQSAHFSALIICKAPKCEKSMVSCNRSLSPSPRWLTQQQDNTLPSRALEAAIHSGGAAGDQAVDPMRVSALKLPCSEPGRLGQPPGLRVASLLHHQRKEHSASWTLPPEEAVEGARASPRQTMPFLSDLVAAERGRQLSPSQDNPRARSTSP